MSDLTAGEKAFLAKYLKARIAAAGLPLSPRLKRMQAILDKLEPPAPGVANPTPAPPAVSIKTDAGEQRCVVVHYHLFKNAGTSVDKILQDNFGSGWATAEYAGQPVKVMAEAVRDFLIGHPEIRALSSHSLRLTPPDIPGVEIFPIVFVRHPIDRIRSAYGFQRAWAAEDAAARVAREIGFASYIRVWLSTNNRHYRNFQTWRLSMGEPAASGSELERALRTAERLPFVGCVEAFDASMRLLEPMLAAHFPGFRTFAAYENVLRPGQSLEARLAEIKSELGEVLYDELVAANADDLLLQRRILARYAEA